ncbi:TRAP transporter small permease [Alkalihalobacillus sp. MEB130]|uniref:TRAP transporter small permease n=1 Tax=Alkalihalobacillus sp. MEB130 TaxID=2976704 RepID=UPI0028DDC677|nr:TRAP transporter small permease [Alkalihalobacillus sp. MEB130]MDT8859707.1 TRAP transporter small permease [Alkalihalobacillus sp. MEB130]
MSSNAKEVQKELLGSEDPNNSSSSEQTSKLGKFVHSLNNATHRVSMLVLFLMMFLTTGDVIGRYFFYKPITGTYELTGLAMVIVIFLSLGRTQLKKEHISIDFLTSKLPVKIRESLNVFTSTIMLALLGITSWQLFAYAQRFGVQTSGDLGIPMKYFAIVAAIGVLFYALTIILNILQSISKVVQKNES